MKKIIFTATLFTLSLVTFAQAPTISVQANGLYSNLSFDGYEKFDGFGYSFGIAGDFPLSEKMSIRPEINIQQRRLKNSYEESYSSAEYVYEELYNYKINMSYLDIPILIQYKPTKHIGFYAGPQFGTSLGTKTTVEYSASEVDKSTGEKY